MNLKLARDAREAKERALTAAALVADDGSCNLDATALHLEKGERSGPVISALAHGGLSANPARWLGRCVMINPPGVGQAGKRYASNQALYKSLQAAGWRVTPYLQMD